MFYCTNGKRVRWKCHRNASTWYMIEPLLVKNVDDSHTHIDRHFCFQFIRRMHCSLTFHYLTWENPIEILMRKTFLPCINYERDLGLVSQFEIQKYVPKVLRVHIWFICQYNDAFRFKKNYSKNHLSCVIASNSMQKCLLIELPTSKCCRMHSSKLKWMKLTHHVCKNSHMASFEPFDR